MSKFETEYGTELSEVLIAMGMEDAFNSGAADFSRLGNCDEGNIFIGRVLHNTYLSVGELGTRAGAATAVEMVAMGANIQEEIKTVVLDRPFVYMIVDWEYRQPLFLGAMMDPV